MFVAFISFYLVLSISLMIFGIFIAITWLFQYGLWAAILVIIAILVVYYIILSIGFSLLERKI